MASVYAYASNISKRIENSRFIFVVKIENGENLQPSLKAKTVYELSYFQGCLVND